MNTLDKLEEHEKQELAHWFLSLTERQKDMVINSYSTKFSYHIVRLALEAEQILETGTVDLERDREILKSVRRGEWTIERIEEWFNIKESSLEDLYSKSTIQEYPDWNVLKTLLIQCLEEHYGSLDNIIKKEKRPFENIIFDIENVLEMYR